MEGIFSRAHSQNKTYKKQKIQRIRDIHLATAENDLQKLKAKLKQELQQARILNADNTLNFREFQAYFCRLLKANYKLHVTDNRGNLRVENLIEGNITKLFLHYDIKSLEYSGLNSKDGKVHSFVKRLIFDFLRFNSQEGNFLANLYPPFYISLFAKEMNDIRSKDEFLTHFFDLFLENYTSYVDHRRRQYDRVTIINELIHRLKSEQIFMDPNHVDLIHELNVTKSMEMTLRKNFNGPEARQGKLDVIALLQEPVATVFALLHAQHLSQTLMDANKEVYSKIKNMIFSLIKPCNLEDLRSFLANVMCADDESSSEEEAAAGML